MHLHCTNNINGINGKALNKIGGKVLIYVNKHHEKTSHSQRNLSTMGKHSFDWLTLYLNLSIS